MSLTYWMSLARRTSLVGSIALLAAGLASAQPSPSQTNSAEFSSSNDPNLVQVAESFAPEALAALPSAPAPAASAAGQDNGQGNRGWKQNLMSKYALEIGGGFDAPTDKSYITWGGQFTVGGGVNFSKRFALLAEYQLIDDKLPGALIAETGASGGYAHIWSLTLDPVVSLFPKSSNDVYVTGGGGFYRKVTSFTDPEEEEYCDYYYGYCGVGTVNAVVGHFSSNQGGINIGGGYQHRMGGMYQDSKMKLFVEARYVDVFTPAVVGVTPNGLGETTVVAGTRVIPVSVGIRW
ncbi:MAG: hypothetical protein WA802_17760 [Terracidiphilus sp.]|jgi:hypothetical protein